MRILVVEDEVEIAQFLREALERLGNDCLLAADAGHADRLLAAECIDAVTLDLGLPDAEGLDWLESRAATYPELVRRTLVITGRPLDPADVTRLARCGAGVLAKPFTLATLGEAVRCQLEHRDGDGDTDSN